MRTAFFLFASVMVALGASAQSLPPTDKETAYIMVDDSLVGGIVLDTLQRRQLAEVERRYQKNYETVLENDTLGDAAMRLQLDQLTARRNAEIERVMTSEQYAEWQRITGADPSDPKRP